jgi:hypothetical protein
LAAAGAFLLVFPCDTVKSARARLAEWAAAADPMIAAGERRAQEVTGQEAKVRADAAGALQGRAQAGTLLREIPALFLFKPRQTPEANYVRVVGHTADVPHLLCRRRAVEQKDGRKSKNSKGVARFKSHLAFTVRVIVVP